MKPQALYRFWSASGQLLYVGISANPGSRWKQHRDDKPWWMEVANVTLEHFYSREAVEAAERTAIINEQPRYNIVHSTLTNEGFVRSMSRRERVVYLKERGWTRLGSSGAQSWTHPDYPHTHASLAWAIRKAVEKDRGADNLIRPAANKSPRTPRIQWICEVCSTSIHYGNGYLQVSYVDIHAYLDAIKRQKELPGAWPPPQLAHWWVTHSACDPLNDNVYHYNLDRVSTYQELMGAEKHVSGKRWFAATDWDELCSRACFQEAM